MTRLRAQPSASAPSILRVRLCSVATSPLPLVDPLWELARRFLRGSWPLPLHLPAALRSTGITPLLRYYGGSDSCAVPSKRVPALAGLNASI
jgi:hypothetical protein